MKSLKKEINRIAENKWIIILVTLIFFLTIIYIQYDDFSDFQMKKFVRPYWNTCLDNLDERGPQNFYKDQADCYQPPMHFMITYFLKKINEPGFYHSILYLVLMTNLINFLIILRIIRKETKRHMLFIPLILYSFTFLVLSITSSYEVTVSSSIFLIGFYLLFYSELKNKEIVSGIFFTLAIFIYQIYFFIVSISILYYFIKDLQLLNYFKRGKKLNFYNLKKGINLLLPPFTLFLVFQLIFPGYFMYSFGQYVYNLFMTWDFIYNFNLPGKVIHLFFLFFAIYFFIRKRDVNSYILLIYTPLTLFVFFFGSELYKMTVILPIFIICFMREIYSYKESKIRNFMVIILISLLIFPGINAVYLINRFNDLAREVGYPINFIPEQKGRILADVDRFKYYAYPYDYDIDIIKNVGERDRVSAPVLEELGLVNLTEWIEEERQKKYSPIIERLRNNEYTLYILGESYQKEDVYRILNTFNYSLCTISLVNLESENPKNNLFIFIIFNDKEECNLVSNQTINYYMLHFESICRKDQYTANLIRNLLLKSYVSFDKYCRSNKGIFYYYANINNYI